MKNYKHIKRVGALQESSEPDMSQQAAESAYLPEDSYAASHHTNAFPAYNIPQEQTQEALPLGQIYSEGMTHSGAFENVHRLNSSQSQLFKPKASVSAPRENASSFSAQPKGKMSMFFYVIPDGQQVLVTYSDGRMEILKGPQKVWRPGRRFQHLAHHVVHPGEFLILRFRDGSQKHLAAPAQVFLDPREHLSVTQEESVQLAEKEAVVVYSKSEGKVSRRIVYGPEEFMPEPGEWLHTFSWHGSKGGSAGYQKVPNALVFQKLWMLPDQMYHDIPDVRTADGVEITIRLMLFFELIDINTMLLTTHDPIGDFVNAATSDVVEFVSKLGFEEFKGSSERLNLTETYKQLSARAENCGYRINRVVYRGYGAPAALQKMHEQGMEARTRLQLEKATAEQAQKLADFKLERRLGRETQEALVRAQQQQQQIELKRVQDQADIEAAQAQQEFEREQKRLDNEQRSATEQIRNAQYADYLSSLKAMGVDLSRYLTQNQADRVFEVRGNGAATHLHLETER